MLHLTCRTRTALAATVFAIGLSAGGAHAQTATDLDCKGCVQTKEIAGDAVTTNKIRNKAVTREKLAKDARPGGVEFKAYPNVAPLSTTEKVYARAVMTVPAPGYVYATVSGNILFDAETTVDCYFDDGSGSSISMHGSSTDGLGGQQVFSHTHVIELLNAGKNVIKWRCSLRSASDSRFNGYEISALFVPSRY